MLMQKKYVEQFPNAVLEILPNMYVDDVLTGADTIDASLKLQQDMSKIMTTEAFKGLCQSISYRFKKLKLVFELIEFQK